MSVEELELDISVLDEDIVLGIELYQHPNGGGLVAETAIVEPSVYIAPTAAVLGNAIVRGNVKLYHFSEISGNATVSGNVILAKNAKIAGNAFVHGNIKVGDDSIIEGNAIVKGNVTLMGQTKIVDSARLNGKFYLSDTTLMITATLAGQAVLNSCLVAAPIVFPAVQNLTLTDCKITDVPLFLWDGKAVILCTDDALFLNERRIEEDDLIWGPVLTGEQQQDALLLKYNKLLRSIIEMRS